MCSSKPKVSSAPAAVTPPPPPPEPAKVAELDVSLENNPDSTSSKNAKKREGRSSLRVQRQAGVGGSSIGAGLSIPKG
jgi:hypothetical protein